MAFLIIHDDITRVKADAIVNTANPEPVYAPGTDQAIYEAAGKEALLAERRSGTFLLERWLSLPVLLCRRNIFFILLVLFGRVVRMASWRPLAPVIPEV